ncbi:MAG: hypothetical protein HF300_15745 [Ignavibacteria bacterium]|jgi:hypothetical protein|nr:hypothetical protein [Ignavibacteria bacterium]MCU7514011.1 hypothetical protein [Ignavibacteria bacterium]MCU7522429.1 hypothetical protein [Ignavibacteria bacterium]
MEMKFCQSCGVILDGSVAKEGAPGFCTWCVDEKGNLKAKEEVKAGVADWLKSFTPEGGNPDFMERAENYLNAMPAWAKK